MSNLNVNNIDVQRIINILNELMSKTEICSFLTFKTKEKLESKRDELLEAVGEEFVKDLDEQFSLMQNFSDNHLREDIIQTKNDKSNADEDEEEDESNKNKHIIRLRENLNGIDENKDELTIQLAKNTRSFCRKYYKNKNLIDYMQSHRGDVEIIDFVNEMRQFLNHNIKKCKMTFEEELSDSHLSKELFTKIFDLEKQIMEKENKYKKLKQDHHDLKTNSLKKLEEINNQIEMIRSSTDKELKELQDSLNKQLYETEEKHLEDRKKLEETLKEAKEDFTNIKRENEIEEENKGKAFGTLEKALKNTVSEYDTMMNNHKANMIENYKNYEITQQELKATKIKRDKKKESYNSYKEAYDLFINKMDKLKYEEEVKLACSEYIQAVVRGYQTRKALLKKFKFLKVLRAPKIIENDTTNARGGRGGRGR